MKNKHNLYGRQLALVSAVVGKTNRYSDGNPVRTYRTACGGFILHDCTPSNGQPYGQLCVHVPGLTEPGKLVPLTVKA
jgi:hypothetical protein